MKKNAKSGLGASAHGTFLSYVESFGQFVLSLVSQRVCIAWLCWDICISVGHAVLYWQFPKAVLLQWHWWTPIFNTQLICWRGHVVICCYHLACSLWGLCAVLLRNTIHLRRFYGFLLLNVFVTMFLMIPWGRLECSCASEGWLQCEVLQSFARDGRDFNRYHVPQEWSDYVSSVAGSAKSGSRVSEQQPPTKYSAEEFIAKKKGNGNAASLIQQTEEMDSHDQSNRDLSVDVFSHGHARLVSKRRKQNAEGSAKKALALHLEEQGLASSAAKPGDNHSAGAASEQGLASSAAKPGDNHSAGAASDKTQRVKIKQNSGASLADSESALLSFYRATKYPPEFSEMLESCETEQLGKAAADSSAHHMDAVLDGKAPPDVDRKLMKMLQYCSIDQTFAAVSWSLLEAGSFRWNSTICLMRKIFDPKPGFMRGITIPQNSKKIYLLEDEDKMKDYEATSGRSHTVDSFFMALMTEGDTPMGVVKKLYNSACTCEDEDSCKYHIDGSGQVHNWCYIRGESSNIYNCRAAGYQVFLDHAADKPWSEGPCTEKACQCSSIGMTPGAGNSDVNEDLFAGMADHKRSYYGSRCNKWDNTDDTWEWCYVGWDSACPDRKRDMRGPGADWPPNVKAQFKSFLACNGDELQVREEEAMALCEEVLLGSTVVVTIYAVLLLPTLFIFYKFISNEGHAYVKTESQFEVDLSTSEEEEDEFTAGQTGKAGESDKGESSKTDKGKETRSTTDDDKKADEQK